ncbi:zinc finger protein-domain-containing protein [Lasiosphaeria hispida]|uniref:Zinc finger protein-domain-containing protein n=1 Tax=Lasiosphaeria hispida TaxID=260671 RepID=A0AAJ0H7Z6_9PEZI|nr:zinc finger protein-domain-containing protein [Lasiosphaeria hispida]
MDTLQLTKSQSRSTLERIGYGSCGSVWADSSFPDIDQRASALVLKRGDGLPDRSLSNEGEIHRHILSTLQTTGWDSDSLGFKVNIPLYIDFLQPESASWANILPRLPSHFTACQALISERIMPMPRPARELIVECFWTGSEDMNEVIFSDKRNEHCLLRPYLGRRKTLLGKGEEGPRRSMLKPTISLRNYPLHINQIEALGLPAAEYASAMADALAFLLWEAQIDVCDVEFVLARPRSNTGDSQPHLGSRSFTPGVLGPHSLWILDFDCCRKLSMDGEGVQLAVERFWRNDPFYPTPDTRCGEDVKLWDVFSDRFLETSRRIMEGKDEAMRQLPRQFISRITKTIGVYTKGVPL